MKKLIRKIGLSVLGATISCLILSVVILIFNGIGHIVSNVFEFFEVISGNKNFIDYVVCGVMAMLILFFIIVLFIAGYFLMLRFATRYNEKKKGTKREPFECPYDLKSCDHVDTSILSLEIDCEDCPRYGKGIRPSKI